MKIKIIIALLIVSFTITAQDVNYKFSGPIKKINGFVFGNEKDGFIKVDYNFMTLRIHTVDPETYHTKEISITSDFFGVAFNKNFVKGNYAYMFYSKKDIPYVIKIDLSGEISEPIKLEDKTNRLYYSVLLDNVNDFFIMSFGGDSDILNVYDLEFNLVKSIAKDIPESMEYPSLISAVYDENTETIYAGCTYVSKRSTNWSSGQIANGVFILNDTDAKLFKTLSGGEGFLSTSFIKKGADVKIVGIAFSKETGKTFSFISAYENDLEVEDKLDVKFVQHINYIKQQVKSISFRSYHYQNIYLNNGSLITCDKMILEMGEKQHNFLFTKYDNEGNIMFNKIISVAEFISPYDGVFTVNVNLIHPKFTFSADENFIYVVYEDFLEKIEIENEKYSGRYIFANKINNYGEGQSKLLFNSEKKDKTNLYHVFKNSFNPNPKTFVTYAYKKKKEDLIIEVKFED